MNTAQSTSKAKKNKKKVEWNAHLTDPEVYNLLDLFSADLFLPLTLTLSSLHRFTKLQNLERWQKNLVSSRGIRARQKRPISLKKTEKLRLQAGSRPGTWPGGVIPLLVQLVRSIA
jgi:hypothetical protein